MIEMTLGTLFFIAAILFVVMGPKPSKPDDKKDEQSPADGKE